jgi:hypothetical protein
MYIPPLWEVNKIQPDDLNNDRVKGIMLSRAFVYTQLFSRLQNRIC